jgi:hypothetical protein
MRPAQRLLVSRRRELLALKLGRSPQQHQYRSLRSSPAFARQSDGEESDKSWSEIARGAASVAGCAVGTLDSLSRAFAATFAALTMEPLHCRDALKKLVKPLTSLAKSPEPKKRALEAQPRLEDDLAGAITGALSQRGGLLGNVLGRVVGAGINALAGSMQEAMRSSKELSAEAADAVAHDERVLAALGGPVRCGPPSSVSSSTQIMNGVKTNVTRLGFAAEGPYGRARVDVGERNGATDIRVTLGSGAVIAVKSGAAPGAAPRGGGSGRVIDVDAKDYRIR